MKNKKEQPSMLDVVNELIRTSKNNLPGQDNYLDPNLVSDGYHTFGELYEHRITLFIALGKVLWNLEFDIWKSKKHHDGSEFADWFIMGIGQQKGGQISYHLPISKWDEVDFAEELEKAPEWDGHTSADVLERLKSL